VAKPIELLKDLFASRQLRSRLLVTILVLFIFRLVTHIPVPGVNTAALSSVFASNQLLSLLDIFSGGTLANFSILALGLNPYINSSIIMQLMTMVVPRLEELQKEGESGQSQINQYTRMLAVPLALLQSGAMYTLLSNADLINVSTPLDLLSIIITLTAGSLFLMWLGENLTEYGIGNGISMLIFAGIVGRLPVSFLQTTTQASTTNPMSLLIFVTLALCVVYLVVFVDDARREIPVQYSRRVRGSKQVGGGTSYLPIKLNNAGVIPIIFAIALVLAPSMLARLLTNISNQSIASFATSFAASFTPQSVWYNLVYFLLVVGFTYFYTAVIFDTDKIADQLKKNGGYIPGIRPGKHTSAYLSHIVTRTTLAGAAFLGAIAVLPSILQGVTGLTTLTIGGTSILIVVSVVLETYRKMQSYLVTRNYDSFIR
jgi:preprotein translocase subunit SecY